MHSIPESIAVDNTEIGRSEHTIPSSYKSYIGIRDYNA